MSSRLNGSAIRLGAGTVLPANAHLTLGYTDDDYHDNGYKSPDNGTNDQCAGVGEASVTIDIAPTATLPPPPATASYLFTIENVVIRHIRSQHNDTDVIGAGALVDGTPSDVAESEVGKWQDGSHATNFQTLIDSVTPTDRINLGYTIVNAGNPTSQKTADVVTGTISEVVKAVPSVGSLLGAVTDAIGKWIDFANADCDGPVVAGQVAATGAELFVRTHSTQPYRRTVSFPGVDSSAGCGGNSFYEVTYSIVPSNQDVPFSLQINVPTLATAVGRQAVLLKHK